MNGSNVDLRAELCDFEAKNNGWQYNGIQDSGARKTEFPRQPGTVHLSG